MSPRSARRLAAIAVLSALAHPASPAAAPWVPDQRDGTYRNPVLFADYSDPDAVRVGNDFYLTASSFNVVPGLPILRSTDLVNWTLINHALARLPPDDFYARPRHGQGVWAPAIRHHGGRFWIFYSDPDYGLYVTTAADPAGAWSPPRLFLPGRGLIDPCPFWDDDGRLYLIHAWARSRAGISNRLTLHRLSPDAGQVLDAGQVVVDADRMAGWHTLEGPKLYKHRSFYYIFAPAGGVATGYQAVFRAKTITGPYEERIVLDQGRTAINGPHQGAWIETASGEDWFLHFQDRGPYGRVVHLEPLRWHGDWPVIGADPMGTGTGEPVAVYRKPAESAAAALSEPATSDEFTASTLSLAWQWNANPRPTWASLTARPGFLRLACVPVPAARNDGSPADHTLYDAPNFLLQKFPAPAFTVTTSIDFAPAAPSDLAGLAVFGFDYAVLGLCRVAEATQLVLRVNRQANRPGTRERDEVRLTLSSRRAYLRVAVGPDALCRFSYSLDNMGFSPVGEPFPASGDRWIGAKVGLIASAAPDAARTGYADFHWFRFAPPGDPTPHNPSP
jgi:beta-xylosidase